MARTWSALLNSTDHWTASFTITPIFLLVSLDTELS